VSTLGQLLLLAVEVEQLAARLAACCGFLP